jgi:methionyl-tRNA formyltransferase
MGSDIKIIYAGDRDISVKILTFIKSQGVLPVSLFTPPIEKASHAKSLVNLCGHLSDDYIFNGVNLKDSNFHQFLRKLHPDWIICIHFPYYIPKEIFEIPAHGVINLHPAYLPYNKGWHTPSWAILEDTPYGATLHFMAEEIDAGDIIHQKKLEVLPSDTADSLYKRVLDLEYEVFTEAWPKIASGKYEIKKQPAKGGTTHTSKDLFEKEVQVIDLKKKYKAEELIKKLRALTTNKIEESAYFEVDGKTYRIQVKIFEESSE